MTLLAQCNRYRKRYIELCTKRKLLNSSLRCEPLSDSEEAELDLIERTLPVDSLLLYRRAAVKDAIVRNKRKKREVAKAEAEAKAKSWFGGWGWGGGHKSAPAVAEGDVSLEELQMDLEKEIHAHLGDTGAFTLDVSFVSSTVVSVTTHGQGIATMKMGLSASCSVRGDGMQAEVQMTNLLVTDEFTPSPVIPDLIAVRSTHTHTSPAHPSSPFTVNFRNTNGKIHVAVRALPLQVTFNKFCIQQLLGVVQVSSPHTPLSELKQLQDAYTVATASSRRVASDSEGSSAWYALATGQVTDVPSGGDEDEEDVSNSEETNTQDHARRSSVTSSIEVDFEAEAPKIVIPEDSCHDMGFLLLDTGRLMVSGEMGSAGMAWQVKLCAINAALPRSVDELSACSAQSHYLIRPFDVEVDAQSIDKTSGDMTVAIRVIPNIRGELSADKLSSLMHILDVLPSTFSKLPSDDDQDGDTAPADSHRTDAVVSAPAAASAASSLTFIDSRAVDPTQRNMVMVATIPAISLDLQYGSSDTKKITLGIDMLRVDITTRPYDMHLALDVRSMSIQDFTRAESQLYLARSPPEEQESLVHITYTKLNHIKSPLYTSFGTEISVEMNKLLLNSDSGTLLHLRPFYEVALGKRLTQYPPELVVSPMQSQPASSATGPQTAPAGPVLEYVPQGMHVRMMLCSLSVELLRAFQGDDKDASTTSGSAAVLDSVVCLDINGLATEITMGDGSMAAAVNMKSLTVRDTRDVSSEYHFRTILGPVSMTPTHDEGGDETGSSVVRNRSTSGGAGGDLLRVSFSEDSNHASKVTMDIGAVTSFVSLDMLLDLANVAMCNVAAVVQLTSKVDSSPNATPPSPSSAGAGQEVVTSTPRSPSSQRKRLEDSSNSGPGKELSVEISLQGARVIMLEDPTEINTRAMCLRLGMTMLYHALPSGTESHRAMETTLESAITDIEVYVILDMQRNRPHPIMDPLGVTLQYKTSSERDVALTTHVTVEVDSLFTRFSLADIMLVQTILLRRTVVDSPTAKYASASQATSRSDGTPEVEHLTQYSVKVNVGAISATVVNDFEGKNMPIVRLSLENTFFQAGGFLRDMQGGGNMVLAVDTYNAIVTEWEPLLETWHPTLTVSSDSTDIRVKITSAERLQVSLSSTFLSDLSRILSVFELMNQPRSKGRGAIPSLTITNRLGIPIEVVHSATRHSIFRLDKDHTGAIFLHHRSTGDVLLEEPGQVSEVLSCLPTAVDILFNSQEMDNRQPLTDISVASVSRRQYAIQAEGGADGSMGQTSPEPVVESVYQYQRYWPIKGWGDSCLLGDPPEWSDAAGSKDMPRSSVELPEAWEWVGDWKVDTSGQAQGQVDKDGWEYAVNFTDFTPTSRRRGESRPMDYARRRKWVRTRAPQPTTERPYVQAMTMLWDVHLLDDGSKKIELRSCLQIDNQLPYAVKLQLTSRQWQSPVELGPLCPNDVLSVPLLCAAADEMSFKSSEVPTNWTTPLPCTLQAVDGETQTEVACTEEASGRMLHIRPVTRQVKNSLQITLSAPIRITNTVPSRVGYRFYINGAARGGEEQRVLAEEGWLEAGGKSCLSYVKVTHITHVALNVGDVGWSETSDPIFDKSSNTSRVNVPFLSGDGKIVLILRLRINQFCNQPYEVIVFSKDALINYSGLDVSVDCLVQKGRSDRVVRFAGGGYDTSLAGTASDRAEEVASREDEAMAAAQSSIVGIDAFATRSRRHYRVTHATVGDAVHTDRCHRFTFLPLLLRGQTFISTPCNDRDLRVDGNNMISFTATEASVVLVLFDKRVCSLPSWVKVCIYVYMRVYIYFESICMCMNAHICICGHKYWLCITHHCHVCTDPGLPPHPPACHFPRSVRRDPGRAALLGFWEKGRGRGASVPGP